MDLVSMSAFGPQSQQRVFQMNTRVIHQNGHRYTRFETGTLNSHPTVYSEIFVAGLPRNAFEDTIYDVFSQFGEIFSIKIFFHYDWTSRSFCFVRFATRAAAVRAVHSITNKVVKVDYPICVEFSVNNNKLYICTINITKHPMDSIVPELLESPGIKNIIFFSTRNRNRFRITIEFFDHTDLKYCRRRMLAIKCVLFDDEVIISTKKPPYGIKFKIARMFKHFPEDEVYLAEIWNPQAYWANFGVQKFLSFSAGYYRYINCNFYNEEMIIECQYNHNYNGCRVKARWA